MSEKPNVPTVAFTTASEDQVKERTKQAPDFKTVYFNHTRIAPSFYDVRVFFGQSSVTPKGEQTFEEQLCVVLAPELAKNIAELLIRSMQKYETIFGKIRSMPVSPGSPAQSASGTTKRKKK